MNLCRTMQVENRMKGIEASANHQYYIRSHGRVAECYFIYNPKFSTDALVNECYRNPTQEESAKLSLQKRSRHVYGPRVIDMSTENGKHLLNWIFGDVCNAGAFGQKLPRYWSIFCGSLAEQPAFEVVLKERPLTKVRGDVHTSIVLRILRCQCPCSGSLNSNRLLLRKNTPLGGKTTSHACSKRRNLRQNLPRRPTRLARVPPRSSTTMLTWMLREGQRKVFTSSAKRMTVIKLRSRRQLRLL